VIPGAFLGELESALNRVRAKEEKLINLIEQGGNTIDVFRG